MVEQGGRLVRDSGLRAKTAAGVSHPHPAGDSSLGPACPPLTPAAAGSPPVPPAGDWQSGHLAGPVSGSTLHPTGPSPRALGRQLCPYRQQQQNNVEAPVAADE